MLSSFFVSIDVRARNNNFLVVILEATSVYGDHIVYFIKEDSTVNQLEPKLHVLNPKQVANFKKTYPDIPMNDWIDA